MRGVEQCHGGEGGQVVGGSCSKAEIHGARVLDHHRSGGGAHLTGATAAPVQVLGVAVPRIHGCAAAASGLRAQNDARSKEARAHHVPRPTGARIGPRGYCVDAERCAAHTISATSRVVFVHCAHQHRHESENRVRSAALGLPTLTFGRPISHLIVRDAFAVHRVPVCEERVHSFKRVAEERPARWAAREGAGVHVRHVAHLFFGGGAAAAHGMQGVGAQFRDAGADGPAVGGHQEAPGLAGRRVVEEGERAVEACTRSEHEGLRGVNVALILPVAAPGEHRHDAPLLGDLAQGRDHPCAELFRHLLFPCPERHLRVVVVAAGGTRVLNAPKLARAVRFAVLLPDVESRELRGVLELRVGGHERLHARDGDAVPEADGLAVHEGVAGAAHNDALVLATPLLGRHRHHRHVDVRDVRDGPAFEVALREGGPRAAKEPADLLVQLHRIHAAFAARFLEALEALQKHGVDARRSTAEHFGRRVARGKRSELGGAPHAQEEFRHHVAALR